MIINNVLFSVQGGDDSSKKKYLRPIHFKTFSSLRLIIINFVFSKHYHELLFLFLLEVIIIMNLCMILDKIFSVSRNL
jgi:hypothetical protein